jgi:hypothetical protein
METYETTQPWVCYRYGLTHDGYWPFWNSTRFLGVSKIEMECCVCGHREVARMKIPRWGEVPVPKSGRHPVREAFLAAHAHPDRGHPMSWALPLRNPAAFGSGGIDLDLLAARLEADMNDSAAPQKEDG